MQYAIKFFSASAFPIDKIYRGGGYHKSTTKHKCFMESY